MSKHGGGLEQCTYRFLFDAIGDALNDVFYDAAMVAVGLIAAETHHPPSGVCNLPVDLDDAVVDLFACLFQPKDSS